MLNENEEVDSDPCTILGKSDSLRGSWTGSVKILCLFLGWAMRGLSRKGRVCGAGTLGKDVGYFKVGVDGDGLGEMG